jgi:ABC-type enterobactin transport system permease subunit
MFAQRSYRSGLGAPLAVGNIANPVAAAAIGVLLLGEGAGIDGVAVALALAAAAITAVGVYLLSNASHEPSTTREAHRAPHPLVPAAPAEPRVLVSALGR